MKLYVYVWEARDLPENNCYVKLQVGKHKSKTRTLKITTNAVWNEEFVFKVHDIDEELVVSVFRHDDDLGFFNGSSELMGRVRIQLWSLSAEDNHTLPPTWFSLEKPNTQKYISNDCGKVLLTVSLHGKFQESHTNHINDAQPNVNLDDPLDHPCISLQSSCSKSKTRKMPDGKQLKKAIVNRLEKLFNKNETASRPEDSSEISSTVSEYEDCMEENLPSCSFKEALDTMNSKGHEQEMPEDLQGGVLIDHAFQVSPNDLNLFIFAPNSQFMKDLAELQGTTDVQEEPWIWNLGDTSCLTRVVSYTKAASKLIKAVRATEVQTYLKADGREYDVLVNVSTPEVPYGNIFKVELLYKIMPGPELSSGEETSHLVVSWGINFMQATMMKGMIEGGVRQGLKEGFNEFESLLSQNLKTLDSMDLSDKDSILESVHTERQSDWELATEYFGNVTVLITVLLVLYIFVHILLCKPSQLQGLEIYGVDLPDSFGEFITSGILAIQLVHIYNMVSHFIQARWQNGNDHGVKAQGNGWVLTIALIEGSNITSLDSSGLYDPYVVFTCNGKTRTSSVKLQESDPQWNEILEFDAMEEPPSVLDVEVYDFDGPFDQAASLGHAEINFLKHSSNELADLWVSLEGKLAQSSQSKLHLRIFLNNNKGDEAIREYLTKMEKEVGKKLNLRSPHRNSTFQKLFGLPPEEFLISVFTCQLKRKIPLHGRLFLSARIVGFYANLFGHKTKFFFLWEDIEDIQELPPTLSSVGSPLLVIVLKRGRGLDARHCAKSQDEEGRLRFYFQSFVSFNEASRTIMALWRTRALALEQKDEISEEQEEQEERSILLEETGSIMDVDETKISKIYAAELPVSLESLMEIFGGKLEHKLMAKCGCLNYATTPWEPFKPDILERHLSYKFNRHISVFGGEVTCTQQKIPIANGEGWILNEVMALHGVPFCEHFRVHFRYQIEKSGLAHNACKCDIYIRVTWLKSTKFQQRITQNVTEKFTHLLREIFSLVEREILLSSQQNQIVF